MNIKDKIQLLLFKFKYRKCIHSSCIISNSKQLKLNKSVSIGAHSILKPTKNNTLGKIIFGNNIHISENAYILGGNGKVIIGNNTHAGSNLTLLGGGNITIGNNTLISHNVVIASSSHDFSNKKTFANETPDIFQPIIIKDSAFIGANATILMGTTIGKNAIIGAGSVVTENTIIADNEVWIGNPAKRKYTRKKLKKQIEDFMHSFLKKYPFHNLFLLYGYEHITASELGGTCSDRTINFQKKLEKNFPYLNIKLHRAFINGKKTHTILRLIINNKVYFSDVGMGLPITKLLPIDKNINFISYGIEFKTTVKNNKLTLSMNKNNKEKKLMLIEIEEQSQIQVNNEIKQRWNNRQNLPFNDSLRYFFIYKDKYYQIKDDNLNSKKTL